MSHHSKQPVTPLDVIRILRDHPRRWIVPTVIVTVAAAAYAMTHATAFDATQALMVRDEAMGRRSAGQVSTARRNENGSGNDFGIGSQPRRLGRRVGRSWPGCEPTENTSNWPDNAAIAALQGRVKLDAAQGSRIRQDGSVLFERRSRKPRRGPSLWPPPFASNCKIDRKNFAIKRPKA